MTIPTSSTRSETATPTATPATARVWLLAIRPKTLPAAVAPVLVGTAVAFAENGFAALAAVAALLVALLLQIAANLANDVFDFRRGADAGDRHGPTRVTQGGLIAPASVLRATWWTLGAAMLVGLYLVWRGGWPIAVLGLLAVLSALAYTGGPWPLGYLGLGEVFVFGFFGLTAVAGTAYVQTRDLTGLALGAAVPMGCLATAILVVNNLRDLDTDRAAGKRTLAVRLGRTATRWEYATLIALAYAIPPLLWLLDQLDRWWWLPWLTIPFAVLITRRVSVTTGRALNFLLAATARLQLLFAIAFATSIIL